MSAEGQEPPAPPVRPLRHPKDQPTGPEHVMDFAPLHLGHGPVSKRTVTLVDLDVHVFGLEEITGSERPIAAIIMAHGLANNAKQLDGMASGMLGEFGRYAADGERARTRDCIIVTLDARNHGTRRTNLERGFWETKPNRMVNLALTVAGSMQDHELILRFLEAFLFPQGEREIVEWMHAGISMGGHTTWRLLRGDPRFRVAVPIVGCPTLTFRAHVAKLGLYRSSAARGFYDHLPEGDYAGKKILTLHGALDQMMPYEISAPELDDVRRSCVSAPGGVLESWVQEGRGHVVTPQMVERAAEWFWRHGLSGGP